MSAENEELLPYTMLDLFVDEGGVEHIFMYNDMRIHVSVTDETIQGEGDLQSKLADFITGMDDPEIMFEFEGWVLVALDDFLHNSPEISPAKDLNPKSLLEFYSPPIFAFDLVNRGGKAYAVQKGYDTQTYGDPSPKTAIVDTLPNHIEPPGSAILRSSLPAVPLILASELECVGEGPGTPKLVRWIRDGQVFFFKPGFDHHGHLRELEILSEINRSQAFKSPFETSRLLGLVIWDADSPTEMSLMGFLLRNIEGESLASRMSRASLLEKVKWFGQIEATVKHLHRAGITWGDVQPDNVMINTEGNAVVIDFGGGYTPGYVSPTLQGTPEGDLIGLENMKKELGIC